MGTDREFLKHEGGSNRLLDTLSPELRERIISIAELVPLKGRQLISDIDARIEYVYFPLHGVISVVSATTSGEAVETATIGNEGMTGIAALLGADQMSVQSFVQVPGRAYRLTTQAFRDEIARSDELCRACGRYIAAFITQTAQTSACNRLHTMRQRCARWLLQTHDRVGGATFNLTQEFLAQMLGVRRATVNEVASGLQRDGLIEYGYRQITVVDRDGLERVACECYRIITTEYDRLIGGETMPSLFAKQTTRENGDETALQAPIRTSDTPDKE